MLSKAQLADEKRKEAAYNKLFETVIKKIPGFGQWYGLLISASNLLTQNLPKRVCVDPDGRPIVIYKSNIGQIMGVWAVPTHKVIAEDFSQKKWGKGILDTLTGGQISQMVKQRSSKNICFDISPDEITEMHKRKMASQHKPSSSANKTPSPAVYRFLVSVPSLGAKAGDTGVGVESNAGVHFTSINGNPVSGDVSNASGNADVSKNKVEKLFDAQIINTGMSTNKKIVIGLVVVSALVISVVLYKHFNKKV